MKALTYEIIKAAYDRKGYAFFEDGDFNLNIGGIRVQNSVSNHFDDVIFVAYKLSGIKMLHCYNATTDPGKHWLLNPLNVKGTAIMVPGQYRGAYKIGLHGKSSRLGPYKALEQVKPMKYVRDNNRDNILDFSLYRDPEKAKVHVFWDNIKSNLHRASKWKIVQWVGMYSAACQVIQSPDDFRKLMQLCENGRSEWGNSFTYTLFETKEIIY